MARRPSFEQQLAAVRAGTLEAVRAGLASTNGLVIEAAAKRVEDECSASGARSSPAWESGWIERVDLVPELVEAFARIPDKERDPGCRGKLAVARALHALDRWDDRVFVTGLSISQLEGAQPADDTAAALRGICGLAHAHFARPDALDVLAALLADPRVPARIGAAQGLGDCGKLGAASLLRYKLLADGDDREDPDVTAACVEALLATGREACTDFLLALLGTHGQRAEIVALAIGGARLAGALVPLIAWCDAARPSQRQRVAYLALALLRDDAATAHLLDAIRARSKHDALAAAKALATFPDDRLAARIREAAAGHDAATQRELGALL